MRSPCLVAIGLGVGVLIGLSILHSQHEWAYCYAMSNEEKFMVPGNAATCLKATRTGYFVFMEIKQPQP